jgi:phosphatidylserine/phosphatidylglycerophosphate/cardiolipin synthase-like enzyme
MGRRRHRRWCIKTPLAFSGRSQAHAVLADLLDCNQDLLIYAGGFLRAVLARGTDLTSRVRRIEIKWAMPLPDGANERILILRGTEQLEGCGAGALRLRQSGARILSYAVSSLRDDGQSYEETFHAKIVLADGVAAYVGSANFLYRSRETNLEYGFLLEGDAVAPVAVMVDALLGML